MKRTALQKLRNWKNRSTRKPLIISGARQVGKTWIMKEFGEKEYTRMAYVNFESSKRLQALFEEDFDIHRIITAIRVETGVEIDENTLVIFDEIQEAEGAISSLKYFHENAAQYHVIAAGSLLGVALHQDISFPVGKVEFMNLYPLDFYEFLAAVKDEDLVNLLKNKDWGLIRTFKDRYIQRLREYYYVGGMPEAVQAFSYSHNFDEVRTIQRSIISAYELDFSKHAPMEIVPRISMLWNSLPAQLAKVNKKFIYGIIKTGARAKDYELALSWLINCGLIHQVSRISKPGIPLKAYEDRGAFKLFLVDVGLLGAMGDIDVKVILEGNVIFEEFKGALAEQFVLQQLQSRLDVPINYWAAERASAEIDFLIQIKTEIVPIEVKAEENLQAKSLKSYVTKYKPNKAIRTSMSDYREEEWLTNIPLYAIGEIASIL